MGIDSKGLLQYSDLNINSYRRFRIFMLKKLNNQEYDEVVPQMKRWNKAGGKVLQGLIRRREAEALLYEGKEWHEV